MKTEPSANGCTPKDESSQADSAPQTQTGVGWTWPAVAIIVLAYLVTFLILPHDGFWINDNGCKFIQLQGIVESHYRDYSIPWSGRGLDPAYDFNPILRPFGHIVDGRLYSTFSPVFPLLSSFPYRLLGFGGLYLFPLLGGLLVLPAVWLLAGDVAPDAPARRVAQPAALLIVALGTPMWFYSLTFWEHVPAVCLAIWSVAGCVRFILRRSGLWLVVGAVCCGLSVYLRDELYLLALVLTVLLGSRGGSRWRGSAVFVSVFIVTVIPLWLFQWYAVGHPLGYHFTALSVFEVGMTRHLHDRGAVFGALLFNSHKSMWVSVIISGPFLALWFTYPRVGDRVFRWGVVLIGIVAVVGGAAAMIAHAGAERPVWWLMHANGLFAVSPILIFGLVHKRGSGGNNGAPCEDQRAGARQAIWLITLAYCLLYVLLTPKHHSSGIHWGCRYLLPVYPLLGVLASGTLADWWLARRRASLSLLVVCIAAALSLCAQLHSLTLLHGRKLFSARLNQVVAERPERHVLTIGWFLPHELSHCFLEKSIFLAHSANHGERLIDRLRRAGVSEVLLVAWPPTQGAVAAGGVILDDSPLNFISVEVRPVRLED